MGLQIAADERDHNALDGKLGRGVHNDGRGVGIITAQNNESLARPPLDPNAFQRGVPVDEAGADAALDVFGIDVGTVVDQNDVAGFERGLHRVVVQAEAIAIRGPEVPEHGEHFELFLRFAGRTGRDRSEQGHFAGFERLRSVVIGSLAEQHGFGHVERHGQGVQSRGRRFSSTAFDLGKVSLVDVGPFGQGGLVELPFPTELADPGPEGLRIGQTEGCAGHGDASYSNFDPVPANALPFGSRLNGLPEPRIRLWRNTRSCSHGGKESR